MIKSRKIELSASLEDYLEAILNLSNSGKAARSRDIAKLLEVSKSSVTGALKILSQRGLVEYKPYEPITLTSDGYKIAASVARKHDVIKAFFMDVLGVAEAVAQKAACKAEHSLGTEITNKMFEFVEFVTGHVDDGVNFPEQFKKFCSERDTKPGKTVHAGKPLSNVVAGQTVKLVTIEGGNELRNRLAAMGMVPNADITVISNDPVGPFIINVKGSKIILGRTMAHKIIVG